MKQKIALRLNGGQWVPLPPEPRKKYVPKVWIEPEWLKGYKHDRDMQILSELFTSEASRKEIREHYGI